MSIRRPTQTLLHRAETTDKPLGLQQCTAPTSGLDRRLFCEPHLLSLGTYTYTNIFGKMTTNTFIYLDTVVFHSIKSVSNATLKKWPYRYHLNKCVLISIFGCNFPYICFFFTFF